MSIIRENIKKLLLDKSEPTKRAVTINIDEEQIMYIDKISRVFSKINNAKSFSRNTILEMAITAFIEETINVLKDEYGIDVNMEREQQVSEKVYDTYDLVIFPAHNDAYNQIFLEEKCWYAVRMREDKIPKIKYVAIYRSAPISGITHFARVREIKPYEDTDRKIIYFEGTPVELKHKVALGRLNANAMRSPRYTTLDRLLNAKELEDLFPN